MKLGRAGTHLDALSNSIQAFINETQSHEVVSQLDRESGYYVLRVRWEGSPPADCGVLIGDILFNLRSALDQIVFALSTRAGQIVNERMPAFPIHITAGDFNRNGLKRIQYVPSRARTLIQGVQPYHATNPSEHALALLDQLHERDKHRLLHVVDLAVIRRHFIFKKISSQRYWDISSVRWGMGPFKNGAEIIRARPRKPITNPEAYVELDVARDVCFDDATLRLPEVRVVRALHGLRDYVAGVLTRLELFLP